MSLSNARLRVDLSALRDNYRRLCADADEAEVAPAVKADAYGMGIAQVAPALWQAGARSFFVALPKEALTLRQLLPDARIFVLNGPTPDVLDRLKAADIIPMANSLEQLGLWAGAAEAPPLKTALHLDTGMSRLGLPPSEAEHLARHPELLEGLEIVLVASHLASADEPESPMTPAQCDAFMAQADRLPPAAAGAPRSLANSSGIQHDSAHNLSMVRPGFALYGGNPRPGQPNTMRTVAFLEAPILQVRTVEAGTPVGYNATFVTKRRTRLATLAIGYADGYDRSLSNRGRVAIQGQSAAIVGRVSMDLTVVDVSHLSESDCRPGTLATLLGDDPSLEEVAARADTIGYEILARLGGRLQRRYEGA